MRSIIDAHLDLAWNALQWNRDLTKDISEIRSRETGMTDKRARGRSTVCLPEMRRGGVAVCLATLLVRANPDVQPPEGFRRTDLDVATQEIAHAVARGQLEYYRALEELNEICVIKTRGELKDHWTQIATPSPSTLVFDSEAQTRRGERSGEGQSLDVQRSTLNVQRPIQETGVVIAMEGADPIVSPKHVENWWRDGLRAVGLAHYGQGHYAMGTGGSGPLTAKGKELVRELNRLGMILDLTHSSDPSWFEALDLATCPVMASHNNCRALVPGDRQFSDEQIKLLIDRGGVIGTALDTWMLQRDFVIGQSDGQSVLLSNVVDHMDHVCQIAGNARHAAIGSDLDGGFGTEQSPAGIDTIADLQKLEKVLAERGYSEHDIDNIFHGNWLRFLSEALPA